MRACQASLPPPQSGTGHGPWVSTSTLEGPARLPPASTPAQAGGTQNTEKRQTNFRLPPAAPSRIRRAAAKTPRNAKQTSGACGRRRLEKGSGGTTQDYETNPRFQIGPASMGRLEARIDLRGAATTPIKSAEAKTRETIAASRR